MSTLSTVDRRCLENLFVMSSGAVLDFSNRNFKVFVFEAVNIDIYDDRYAVEGPSKAKRLREFWRVEPDYIVGRILQALIDYKVELNPGQTAEEKQLEDKCSLIAARLAKAGPSIERLKVHARIMNADHLAKQIRRMDASIETDPSLAIGTAKELIETCCKTILADRGKAVSETQPISTLTKETLKELKLVPEGVPRAARGADVIKQLLSNLGTIGNGLSELRGLYGTGHGKHGSASGLSSRHAKLAVGAAATLTVFLFETHWETKR